MDAVMKTEENRFSAGLLDGSSQGTSEEKQDEQANANGE